MVLKGEKDLLVRILAIFRRELYCNFTLFNLHVPKCLKPTKLISLSISCASSMVLYRFLVS